MAPTLGGASNYEGGGVGGKFRRRIFRKSSQTTPYDRPPTATRNPSWLSKLVVDPASKLLDFGARRFFASVFPNKRLATSPSAPPPEERERRNGLQETALDAKIDAVVQEPGADLCGTSISINATSGLPELEQLLKQRTFTRSEIDRLTGLLKSRAIDLPLKDDKHGVELNPSIQDSGRPQELPITSIVNKSESLGAHGSVLDNAITTREQNMQHFEDRIASPAQLAKAYMSSRPATVSPSTLHAQIAWEDSVPPSNSPYASKSRPSPLPRKTSGYSGVPENGFTTPRSRGRSAIYNMARTPYSRFLPVTHQKASGSSNYGDSRPQLLASRPALENGGQVASKPMAVKRRSTVLDEDIGSIGPIRRIRQKHNLLPHGKAVTSSGKGLSSEFTHSPKRPFMGNVDTRGASTSSASYAHVPRESSEMAAKILEHLEKMTPKEKSLESKLAAAREGSAFKLSPHMLHGQALKSMEDLDASKFLTNAYKDPKVVDQSVSHLPGSHVFPTQKQVGVEEQGPLKPANPEDKAADRIIQGNHNSSLGYDAMLNISSQPVEKKHPFKMSAHEDWIEMDDDCSNGHDLEPAGKVLEEPLRDGKSALNEDKNLDKSPVSLEKTPATHLFSKTRLEGGNGMAGENKTGFNFTTSFAPNTSSEKVVSQSTKVADSPLLFNSGTAIPRNNPTSVESKVETSSSLKNVFSGTTNAVVGVTESDTSDKKNPELDNTVNGSQGKPPSPASNPMVTNNVISADARSSNLASNDGPLTSSASLPFSSSAPAFASLANHSFTNSISNMASSAGAATSTSALSNSVLFSGNGTSSSFSENISDNSFSKKVSSSPSKIESREATDVKVEKVNGLGNLTNSSTISTFSGMSNGSSIFGFGASSSSAVNSQWPSSTNGTSDHKESSFAGPGSSTPVQFGSSSSALSFGSSPASPLTSSSIFNSSVATTKSEGAITQSSSSSSASNPVNSINGTAPTFNFGGGASSSSEGNTFGSTTTSSLGAFQFGASSAIPTSSTSSPSSGLFSFNAGSSASSLATSTGPSAGVFNFGAGSSSSATSVTNTSGGFKFGGSTSVSSSSAAPVTSSSTAPAIFNFGASAVAPSSDSNGANSGSFASSLQPPKPTFGSPFSMPSSSSSTGFSFAGSSPAFGTSNSSMVFGSTTGISSNPTFGFSTAASSPLPSAGTPSVFGNSPSPFTTSPGNNHQMSSEDCMAEDPIQSAPAAPVFGQPLSSPSQPSFMFGSTAPSPVAPFQFSNQQSQVGLQNPSPFQASGSLEFNAGGSFSLGSGGGGDKSGRKIVKVNRNRNRKTR